MPQPAFYFAWVDPGTAFDANVHTVQDEEIVSVHCEHAEGDFAALDLVVRNPKVGLLSAGRKVWAWLSWRNREGVIKKLFYGRLIGVPGNIIAETITLSFTARPIDYLQLKIALANSLRVLGTFYDPIFLSAAAAEDPDTILEARPELWAIDRLTHAVTLSNNLVGEDGTQEFLATEVPYDSVQINLNQTPLRAVFMDATITWDQQASGQLDMGERTIMTYTGSSLISGWPKTGAGGSGGWSVAVGEAIDLKGIEGAKNAEYSYSWSNTEQKHAQGDTMSSNQSSSIPPFGGLKNQTSYSASFGIGHAEIQETSVVIPLWAVKTKLVLAYEAQRARVERVVFTLNTNVQPILTMPDEGDVLTIVLNSLDIGETGDIGDIKREAYLLTDRGQKSLKYLIAVARNKLLLRSRAVEIPFACTFERAIELSLRMNGLLHDPRLPGGTALGKIIHYNFDADAESGVVIGGCTIACSVGYGGSYTESPGDPVYAAAGYAQPGYQQYEGKVVSATPVADVTYTVPTQPPIGDSMRFPLDKNQAVIDDEWFFDDAAEQLNTILLRSMGLLRGPQLTIEEQKEARDSYQAGMESAFKSVGTYRMIHMKSVTGGPFLTTYSISVNDLKVPQGIDLESAV